MNNLDEKAKVIVKRVLAKCTDHTYTVEKMEQKTQEPTDVHIEGVMTYGDKGDTVKFSAWLPLLAIRELTNWCSPEIAEMTDYPEMAMDGDWSGVRDTNRDDIMRIFYEHVVPVI